MTSAPNTQSLLNVQIQSKQGMTKESQTTSLKQPECVNALGYLEKGSGQHQSNIVYDSNGLMPTEYAVQYKEPFKILECQRIENEN